MNKLRITITDRTGSFSTLVDAIDQGAIDQVVREYLDRSVSLDSIPKDSQIHLEATEDYIKIRVGNLLLDSELRVSLESFTPQIQ